MEQPIILDGSQIRSVTAQGIAYIDDSGAEQFIDFAQCYESYFEEFKKPRLTPEAWERYKARNPASPQDWASYVERMKRFKGVGARNISAQFIVFYTEPRIRFNFATQDEWWTVRLGIEKARWRTIDLT